MLDGLAIVVAELGQLRVLDFREYLTQLLLLIAAVEKVLDLGLHVGFVLLDQLVPLVQVLVCLLDDVIHVDLVVLGLKRLQARVS